MGQNEEHVKLSRKNDSGAKGKMMIRFAKKSDLPQVNAIRRQGIGTALMNFIKQYAAEQDFDTVELDVWEFNEGARQFYESVGFQTYRRYMEYKA